MLTFAEINASFNGQVIKIKIGSVGQSTGITRIGKASSINKGGRGNTRWERHTPALDSTGTGDLYQAEGQRSNERLECRHSLNYEAICGVSPEFKEGGLDVD